MLGFGDAGRSSQPLPLLLLATSFPLPPSQPRQLQLSPSLPAPRAFLHPGIPGSRQTLKRLPLKQIIRMGKPRANIADLTRPTLLSKVDSHSFSPVSCIFLISQGPWGSKPSRTPTFPSMFVQECYFHLMGHCSTHLWNLNPPQMQILAHCW